MASLVLGVVGRAVAGPFGGLVGGLIGGFIDQQLFGEDRVLEGPRLNNLQVSSSAYGNPIRILYGRMRLGGNIIWSPGIKEHRVEESQGGKGGGPSSTSVSYFYTASFRIGLCEGPVAAILRIWADGKLIVDFTGGTTPAYNLKITGAESGLIGSARFYLGSETQEADPAEQADKGVANTPAYRGQVSIVFEDMPLEDFGNRIPQITVEVATTVTDAFPLVSASANTNENIILRRSLWTKDRRSLISVNLDAQVSRWDAVNQTQIYNKTIVSYSRNSTNHAFPAIDSRDFVYVGGEWDLFLTDGRIYKVDSRTGEVVDQTALGAATFSGNDIEDMIVGGLPPSDVYITALSSNRDVATIRTNDMTVVNLYRLDQQLPNSGQKGLAVDEAGFVWVLFTDPSDGFLVKISPTTGLVLETHVLTGETDAIFLTYLPERNALVFQTSYANGTFKRFDIASGTIDATLTTNEVMASGNRNAMTFRNGPIDGRLWLEGGSNRMELDLVAMTLVREVNVTDWGVPLLKWVQYDAINHALVGQEDITGDPPSIWHWTFLDRKLGTPVALSAIVEDISNRVGLSIADDVDATALTDTVIGFVIDRQMPARRALEPLATAYLFDAREEDSKAQFVKHGGDPVATIAQDDLAARASGQEGFAPRIAEERLREIDLPRRIDMTYLDPSIDFQSNVQGFQRIQEAVSTRRRLRMEMPIAFDNDEAARRIEQIGFLIWQARSRYDINVSRKHIRPSPGDVITVLDGTASFTLRLEKAELAPGGLVAFQGVSEDSVIYSSFAAGTDALGVPTQGVVVAGASALYLLDIPLLRDADEGLGIYLASGAGGAENWPGAAIFKSADGFDFSSRLTFVSSDRNVAHGFAETILADDGARTWDHTNTVILRLFRGALSSSTRLGVLNGANAVLLGDEVIQFVNATLNADGSYTLDTLLRGRRGTDSVTGDHKVGERAVVLSTSSLLKIPIPDSELNAERFYKAVTVGGSLSSATEESFALEGRVLMPYAPVDIRGAIGSPSDWVITWKRRTRLAGAWKDGVDVPLGEDIESYQVDIIDPGSPSGEVVRVLSTTTPQAVYGSAQQIADFGAEQDSLIVRVYQLSATVGRGFPGVATLVS